MPKTKKPTTPAAVLQGRPLATPAVPAPTGITPLTGVDRRKRDFGGRRPKGC